MITLYTKPGCVPCKAAKELLNKTNTEFFEVDLSIVENREEFIAAYPSIRTTPAVFEDGEYIGGYSDLQDRYLRIQNGLNSETQLLEE